MSGRVNLSPRLAMAAGLVPGDRNDIRLADIGTDHAYLPVRLLQDRGADLAHVIAADLRPGPLDRARQTVRAAGLEGAVDFRLCDGLEGLRPGEADVIVIAGMGGETIAHILAYAPWYDWAGITLILQPMSSMPDLRGWLGAHGFAIEREELCREGDTIYTAFLVRAGAMPPLSPGELWAGRNAPGPLRGPWLDLWLARVGRALAGMSQARGEETASRREELERVRADLLEMKKEWETWQR